ncbi:MAG TPA: MBL fold metallo-hydrolase [Candidatus Dormibacteraeota bacterium]|nr:MBL fold metallo-hydrolase [Candidatus Dormibacteraeota bacterium]
MATVRRVVAPNPSPFTGPGTNTWILGDGPVLIVIDPGPDDEDHLAALQGAVAAHAVGVVLVTHAHADHLELAERFAGLHHARVARYPELADGDVVRVGPISLTALHTPGHAPDHLAFWMADDRVLFTGDLVLGRGSSMVTYPEGDVAAYLRSLERVAELRPRMLFPGHWDPVTDAEAKIAEYRAHRQERERQVVDELAAGGPGTARELTERVYAAELAAADGREHLLRAAEMTLRAHLRKLVDEGRVAEREERFELVA